MPHVEPSAFRKRVEHWAAALKVKPTQIRVQRMSRKWASCSPTGRVSFSAALLDQPASFRDYVIVHELLHLRLRNHGKLFAATLAAHLVGNPWVKKFGASPAPVEPYGEAQPARTIRSATHGK